MLPQGSPPLVPCGGRWLYKRQSARWKQAVEMAAVL
jgi:hypothetical protein